MDPIVSVMHLVKHFDDVKAVDSITFFIERKQIFGLLGPNGAGKTTTINILAQILKPDKGQITICGLNLDSSGAEIKKKVGIVPQDLAIYDMLTGWENLAFFGRLQNLTGKELDKRIEESLELVGLTDHAGRLAKTYSGGMKRRLNIACGMLNRPELLILDEPAVGVDPQSRNHILESIKYLNQEHGTSILFTSHYMEEVQQLCSRVAIIDHGKIIADSGIDDLIERFGQGLIALVLEDWNASNVIELLPESIDRDDVKAVENRLIISARNPQRLLPSLLEGLNNRGVKTAEIEIKRSNLETVFLNLTGRSLRDE